MSYPANSLYYREEVEALLAQRDEQIRIYEEALCLTERPWVKEYLNRDKELLKQRDAEIERLKRKAAALSVELFKESQKRRPQGNTLWPSPSPRTPR